jgi:glycosyltransferase involved in cell wall biosynthesis
MRESHRCRRVLVITPEFPTASRPIAGAVVQDHACAAARNSKVLTLHIDRENLNRDAPTNLIQTVRTTFPRLSGKLGQAIALAYLPILLFWIILRYRFLPDVVHGHFHQVLPHAWLTARITRARWVHTEHDSGFEYDELTPIQLRLARCLYPKTDRALTVSENLGSVLEQRGVHADWQVVWNAVDTETFEPGTTSPSPGHVRLLAVGRLDAADRKNLAGLLQALGELPATGWNLTYIGDGPARFRHEDAFALAGLDDRVTFVGAKSRKEVAAAMRQHDVLVHASQVETFSAVVAEALVSGLPVIAFRTGAITDMVKSTAGGVVVDNQEAFVDALATSQVLLKADRRAIAAVARKRLALDGLAETLNRVYAEVAEQGQ